MATPHFFWWKAYCIFGENCYNKLIRDRVSRVESEANMRTKNPELMKEICAYTDTYYREKHASPSVREIAKGVGIAKTTAHRYLVDMNEQGMISYDGEIIGTAKVEKCRSGYFSAPIVGTIRCGDPEQEDEYVEEYVNLPESIFGKGEFYILRAAGDSMVDAGIENGDLVVIRKQSEACEGDIVVALDENDENTLKTFAGIDKESHCAVLRYQNKKKYGEKKIFVKTLVVQGVAKHVIKSL